MVCTMVAFTLGAALVMALSLVPVIAGLQWFTKYPFRHGWRAYPLGKQLPDGDPRLETKLRPRTLLSLAFERVLNGPRPVLVQISTEALPIAKAP